MVFSSLVFLFAFLPIVLTVYYSLPVRLRNAFLLVSSLLFYAWGAPRYVFVLLATAPLDYGISRWLPHARMPGAATRRKWMLSAGIALNLVLLAYFKYANFFVEQVNAVLASAGVGSIPWLSVALPIGISFCTFHRISYLVDVYRGTTAPAPSFANYVLYIVLFPQLVAGPIIRYHDVARQLIERDHTSRRFLSGLWRFCQGLGKKVLIANVLGQVADRAFSAPADQLSGAHAWLGAVCYAFQIYFDFGGYSDMAIGLGRMFGIEFLENFNRPYLSRSFTEFWRRWHISLSNFMREYLYLPLGGNRKGAARTFVNLWIVFLCSGLWHGAAWNFLVWGAYHGLFLSLDKALSRTRWERRPDIVAIPLNFLLVLVSWVLFRADSLGHATHYLARMAGAGGGGQASGVPLLDPQTLVALVVAVVVTFAPGLASKRLPEAQPGDAPLSPPLQMLRYAVSLALLVLSAAALTTSKFNPFIYFRF